MQAASTLNFVAFVIVFDKVFLCEDDFNLIVSINKANLTHEFVFNGRSFLVLTDIYNSVVYFYAGVFFVRQGIESASSTDFLNDFQIWIVINLIR